MKKLIQKMLTGGLVLCIAGLNQFAYGQIVTVGTSAVSLGNIPTPVSVGGSAFAGYRSSHHQIIYTAAELNTLGITGAKWLDSIAWQVQTAPSVAIKNYNIKAKLFTPSSFTVFETIGFIPLVTKPSYLPVTGFQWLAFSTPFYWNGTDNIMFDLCSDSVSTSIISGKTWCTNTGANAYWGYSSEHFGACGTNSAVTLSTTSLGTGYMRPNIKMSFRAASGCIGVPASLTIAPAGPLTNCVNQTQVLQVATILNGPANIQWQRSDNGGAWVDIATNATGMSYIATYSNAIPQSAYRAKITCGTDSVLSDAVSLSPTFIPLYANIPYTQNFEGWINECNVTDAPDSSWVNTNAMGSFSWRREDQGAAANWIGNDYTPGGSSLPYNYYPLSSTANHSARVQSSKGPGIGSLLLFVNCAGPNNGGKELRFDFYCRTSAITTFTNVYCSVDSGATYLLLGTVSNQGVTDQWTSQILSIPSNSPKTIIKFEANSATGSSGDFDMGIDNVRILQACNDAPTAGIVDSNSTCPGSGLTLGLIGNTSAAGLTWLWEQSTNGLTWDTIPGGDIEHPSVVLNGPTWFRCVLACSNNGLYSITAPRLITPNSFYNCYCFSTSTTPAPGINIGNLTLKANNGGPLLINNGNAIPTFNNPACNKHYEDFTTLPPADIYIDSVYKINLNFITRNAPPNNPSMPTATTKVYIDWNHNGSFEASEKAWVHTKPSSPTLTTDSGLVAVPMTAMTGITGMRVISNSSTSDTSESWTACSSYGTGQTEDYLVRIWSAPCSGGSLPGIVSVSDTLSCPGYPFVLTNIDYDSTSALINRVWQQSTNGTTFNDIAGSDNQNVLTQTFTTQMWYRVKSSCDAGGTETYSNAVRVNKYMVCYCASYADGGFSTMQDSSDIGGFVFDHISYPLVGGHLNNPAAIQKYTNHTILVPDTLWVDSTYSFTIDHTMLRDAHMNAKITMFIDYNANGTYDIPDERVYAAISTLQSWQKTGSIVIPANAVLNTATGLRLIINNDTAANVPSDEACGTYTSGETEDYVVAFKKYIAPPPPPPPTSVSSVNNATLSIRIFPNPSTGKVILQYTGANLENAFVNVQNVTGAALDTRNVGKLKNGASVSVDMSQYARGIYFISLESEGKKVTGKVVLQ